MFRNDRVGWAQAAQRNKGSCTRRLLKTGCLAGLALLALLQVGYLSGIFRALSSPHEIQSARSLARAYKEQHSTFAGSLHPWFSKHLNETFEQPKQVVVTATDPEAPQRVLVVYVYADADWRRANLEFFVRHGLVPFTTAGSEVDFTFVFNGNAPLDVFETYGVKYQILSRPHGYDGDADGEADFVGIPSSIEEDSHNTAARLPLIRIIIRPNTGFDFCAAKKVMELGWAARPGTYTHVILINASVRGPFLPSYASFTWVDAFVNQLRGDVKMVGTTVNCMVARQDDRGAYTSLHLQSMVLAMDALGLHAVHSQLSCYTTMIAAISHGEVGSTQAVLKAGYAVAALQSSWKGYAIYGKNLGSKAVDRRCAAVMEETGGDPSLRGAYLGGEVHPYELIFIKTNRQLNQAVLDRFTQLQDEYGFGRKPVVVEE